MIRRAVLAVGLTVAALSGVADGAAVRAQNVQLTGTVGPSFTIMLRDAQGNTVRSLAPGTYDIEIRDQSVEHNFHLTGPGVDRATAVDDTGQVSWTVTVTDGTYRYFCDPHATMMRGSFTVGVVPPPPGPPPPSPPPPPLVVSPKTKLVLTSGPGFSITFKTKAGKVVKRMKRGTYNLLVRDRGRIHNAHVIAPGGLNRKTSPLTYTGTQTWKVKVAKAGTFRFLCDPHASQGMKGSAKVVS